MPNYNLDEDFSIPKHILILMCVATALGLYAEWRLFLPLTLIQASCLFYNYIRYAPPTVTKIKRNKYFPKKCNIYRRGVCLKNVSILRLRNYLLTISLPKEMPIPKEYMYNCNICGFYHVKFLVRERRIVILTDIANSAMLNSYSDCPTVRFRFESKDIPEYIKLLNSWLGDQHD